MYIPENILSANLSNKLLFPTPKKRKKKKKKKVEDDFCTYLVTLLHTFYMYD